MTKQKGSTAGAAAPVRAHAAQARQAYLEGRVAEAEQHAHRALAFAPLDGEANYLLANALRVQNRHAEAAKIYERVIAVAPKHAGALNEYGATLFALGRLPEAEKAIDRAIALSPCDATAFNNLSRLYFPDPAKAAWALSQADKAIALKSDFADAHSNRGTALYLLGRFADAAESHRRAIALKPTLAEAHNNLGNDLQKMGDDAGALSAYRAAIACAPDYADAHLNAALALLTVGELAAGWQAYEHRWQSSVFAASARPFDHPRWDSRRDLSGSLLIWGEQGVGDEVLYAGLVADLAADMDIVWEMDARLVPLMRRSFPNVTAIPRTTPPSEVATTSVAQTPSGSLGQILRPHAQAFPVRRGYLRADADRAATLRQSLGLAPGDRLIGLSWVSKNPDIGVHKTIALAELAPILKQPGLRFVDLQYGDTAAERADIAGSLGVTVHHVADIDPFDDLDGLAALIAACDEVVTVSNTTAHLAGALGVPVRVLIPSGNGKLWYWGTAEKTPWYPTARLYRQQTVDGWSSAVTAVAADLADDGSAPQSAAQ